MLNRFLPFTASLSSTICLYCVISLSLTLPTVLCARQRKLKLYLALCTIAHYSHCVFRGLFPLWFFAMCWRFALLLGRLVRNGVAFRHALSPSRRCASLRVSRRSFRDRNFCMCHRRRLCDFPEYLLRSVHVMSRR